eukprot:TRINITY_DN5229_c0_g1_i2.p2 TRINITY_DN5229_c0_g1~~TRINITY_DN5229_c0_g1_i2.p2  ORF type:complete len:444 (-),score=77.00 TRINITY_DN5229_c0_g1_i2:1084-2259(-)
MLSLVDDMNADLGKLFDFDPFWIKVSPVMHGWLTKDARKVGASKKRYFFLKKKFLFYYESPASLMPIGWISLENSEIDVVQGKFQIKTPGRTYTVVADSPEEQEDWINCLRFTTSPEYSMHDLNDVNDEKDVYKGMLYKRGEHNVSWKERYFILRGSILYYCADENSIEQPLGYILMKNCETKPIAFSKSKAPKYKFVIESQGRTYYLYSSDETDRARWISRLRSAYTSEREKRNTFLTTRRVVNVNTDISVVGPTSFLPLDTESEDSESLGGRKRALTVTPPPTHFLRTNTENPSEVENLVSVADYSRHSSHIDLGEEQQRNLDAIKKTRSVRNSDLVEPLIEIEDSESWWGESSISIKGSTKSLFLTDLVFLIASKFLCCSSPKSIWEE